MYGNNKYSNVLTVLLVIVMIAIIALLIFFGVSIYNKYYITKQTSDGVEQFNNQVPDFEFEDDTQTPTNTVQNETTEGDPLANLINPGTSTNTNTNTGTGTSGGSNSSSDGLTYKGFPMIGTISIPKTDINLPVLAKVSKESIEVSVAKQYGPDLNQPGNVVIIGHNYRNGLFFSNNKKLEVGDKIYIKDRNGITMTYTIYSKFETDENDASFYDRDTNGKCEITLSTCTDSNAQRRLILLARAE